MVYATSALEEQSTPAFLKAHGKKKRAKTRLLFVGKRFYSNQSVGKVKWDLGGRLFFVVGCVFNALMYYVDGT